MGPEMAPFKERVAVTQSAQKEGGPGLWIDVVFGGHSHLRVCVQTVATLRFICRPHWQRSVGQCCPSLFRCPTCDVIQKGHTHKRWTPTFAHRKNVKNERSVSLNTKKQKKSEKVKPRLSDREKTESDWQLVRKEAWETVSTTFSVDNVWNTCAVFVGVGWRTHKSFHILPSES